MELKIRIRTFELSFPHDIPLDHDLLFPSISALPFSCYDVISRHNSSSRSMHKANDSSHNRKNENPVENQQCKHEIFMRKKVIHHTKTPANGRRLRLHWTR